MKTSTGTRGRSRPPSRRRSRARSRAKQQTFEFPSWGGARERAGRKPNGDQAGVSHLKRAALASRFPVHVTVRLRRGLPSLRSRRAYQAVLGAFSRGRDRFGFRLVQYSVMSNHLHLITEAKDRDSLSRGMQGLLVRVAKALNRLWDRQGSVFSDRYHDRILRSPREVRGTLAYVLQNARRHGRSPEGPDCFSSAPWFDGWRECFECTLPGDWPVPVVGSRTWLLTTGWRRHGRIGLGEVPGRIRTRSP